MDADMDCYEEEEFLELESNDACGTAFLFSQHDYQQAGPSQRQQFVAIDLNDNIATNPGDQSFSCRVFDDSNLDSNVNPEETLGSFLHDGQHAELPQGQEIPTLGLEDNFPANSNDETVPSLSTVDPLELTKNYHDVSFSSIDEQTKSSQPIRPVNVRQPDAPSAKESLFSFCGVFHQRLFRNQLRPRELFKCDIVGNSIQEVHQSLWTVSEKEIRREVIFKDEQPNWSDKEKPEITDIEKFLTLQDPSLKKGYSVSALTHRLLTKWRNKTIKVYVYVYSLNVESNAQYKCLLCKLVAPQVPDRAGAHSTQTDAALSKELQEKHPDLEGHHSSWLLWANFIHSSPAHEQEQLKNAESPPVELSKYFRWASVSEAARLQSVHRGMVVARTVNDGWMQKMAGVKKDIEMALTMLNSANRTIDAMMTTGAYGSELFSALETTTRPEETQLSANLANQVADCEDVDHM